MTEALFLTIYSAGNLYLGIRLYNWLRLFIPGLPPAAFWAALTLLAASFFVGAKMPPGKTARRLCVLGGWWVSLSAHGVMLIFAADMLWLMGVKAGLMGAEFAAGPQTQRALGMCLAALTLAWVGFGVWQGRHIGYKRYSLRVNKAVKEPLTVVSISDIHLGYAVGHKAARRVVARVNRAKPDLVLVAGDVFDGDYAEVLDAEAVAGELSGINSRYGVYTCLGNHDTGHLSQEILDFFPKAGICLLREECAVIPGVAVIVGREDDTSPYMAGPLEDALQSIPADIPMLMIDHKPTRIDEDAGFKPDILLCGHTHRGQMFPFTLLSRLVYRHHYGYKMCGGTHVIVGAGVGLWGPPARTHAPAEVVVVEVRSNKGWF